MTRSHGQRQSSRGFLVYSDPGHPFYRRMIEHFDALGAYRTVWEEDGEV